MASKILYVCNDGFYFSQHRAHVARRMAAEGWEVHVATGGAIAGLEPEFAVRPLAVERLSFSPTRDLRLVGQIRRIVADLKPDVVHLMTMKPIVFGTLALLASPASIRPRRVVATFPGLGRAFESSSTPGKAMRALVLRVLRQLATRLPSIATFENAGDLSFLQANGVSLEGRSVILRGAGLDLARFAPGPDNQRDRFRVLWASRLIHGKGLAPFVQAARLARAKPELKCDFLVAGYRDPGHVDSLTDREFQEVAAEPAITFLGHVSDMPALLRDVDLFVLPSRYNEGLPRALIEAAATALPAIASDNAGCRAVVLDGVTGTILPEISDDAILQAVSTYATDPVLTRTRGRAAYDFVHSGGFSEAAVQEAFMTAYGTKDR